MTDIQLPDMPGTELALQATALRPGLADAPLQAAQKCGGTGCGQQVGPGNDAGQQTIQRIRAAG